MQIVKPDININFIGRRKIAFIFSAIVILIGVASLVINNGPKYGVDFAGGTLIQVKFPEAVSIDSIKGGLRNIGLGGSTVQEFGDTADHEFLIRTDESEMTEEGFEAALKETLNTATGTQTDIRRIEMVGPQVGQDLRRKALFAMFFALLFITIYISGRFELKWAVSGIMAGALIGAVYLVSLFNVSVPFLIGAALAVSLVLFWILELKYAMGAIVALLHDVFITIGVFSLFGKEFTLPIIAALLTIIGYSLNDTIIVFDRIRENLRRMHRQPQDRIINRSINETLNRTLLTSMTTLVVLISLFVLGGGIIHDFAFAMIVGVVIGTYSSVFVASPILLAWQAKARGRSGK